MSVLIATAPMKTGVARLGLDLPRRDIFLWVCAIIFLNQLCVMVVQSPSASPEQLITDLAAVGVFQLMAWYAVFRLLASSDPAPVAQWSDFLIAVALCLLLFLQTTRMIWGVAIGVAALAWVRGGSDPKLRAAAIVLAALSVQEYWGRIVFDFFALPLLRAETAVVGTILQVARAGTVWQDNVVTGPSGFGIVVYSACSSFHNLSLAMLCWLTVSTLRDQNWRIRNFVTGFAIGMTMILWNATRLCLMAWNADFYDYWHNGAGAEIFAIGASVAVLLMSLYGSRRATRAP